MAIANLNDLQAAMTSGSYRTAFSRSSIGSTVTGAEISLWRGAGIPATGVQPTTAAICNASTVGALPLTSRVGTQQRVLAQLQIQTQTLGNCLLIEDRLGHHGNLNGTLLTAQPVNLDLSVGTDNLTQRIGASDYSEVEWYLEWYSATGATTTIPTVNVTHSDNTTSVLNIWSLGSTTLPASIAASRRYKIVSTKPIKSVQSVTLSASTGTVGAFGVTAVRRLATHMTILANALEKSDWSSLLVPLVFDNCCLSLSMLTTGTSSGTVLGMLVQAVN
jgi:hypothetical protein